MKIEDVGEFGLIDIINEKVVKTSDNAVVVGIGDDCAVLKPTPGFFQLATTDMLVENIHFKREWISPFQLGYKAMAVNISDIAAMGGLPKHAVVSIAVCSDVDVEYILEIYKGMKEICRAYNVNIVGGDTVGSFAGIIINVTLLGEVEEGHFIPRSGAKVGDIVAVTGNLGDSAVGLEVLLKGIKRMSYTEALIHAHLMPEPMVAAGRMLASFGATSMNDISDGLASEINEIAKASEVGIIIEADKIPISEELRQAADLMHNDIYDYALYGGEDYQLVFTISEENFKKVMLNKLNFKLSAVGRVVEKEYGIHLINLEKNKIELKPRGYNHFNKGA